MTITTSGPEETTKTRQTVPRIALANPKPIEDVGLTLVQQLVSFKHKSSMHPLGPGGAKRPKPKTPRPKALRPMDLADPDGETGHSRAACIYSEP